MSSKKIIEFYDNFIVEQQSSGINDRIYGLFKRLKKLGLTPAFNILELGCGIGTMTFLLSRFIKKGQIEAVDISAESIKFATERIKQPNAHFFVHDIVNYIPTIKNIQFITLFDVIEHIPIERHHELFQNIAKIAGSDTRIIINIPNPAYIEYDLKNNPAPLQIVDQPLPINFIVQQLTNNKLDILFFETYSVWVENDYQFFVIVKKEEFEEINLSSKRNLFAKAIKKIERGWIRLRYPYR